MRKVVIISSPSGCGKDTIVSKLLKEIPKSRRIITSTTRKPRLNEIDRKSYYFITRDKFLSLIQENEFLEWQDVHGELYGTTRSEFSNESEISFVILDVLGAMRIKKLLPNTPTLIFLKPPSREELANRLRKRSSETNSEIEKRLERYDMELHMSNLFDYSIVNSDIQETTDTIKEIIENIK
jgi:guanylate kinase